MKNKLINSIDLNLTKAEIESLISDVKLSLAYVVDVNHDGEGADDLNIGEIRAKSLDLAGTSELTDRVFKPLNANINQYPLAGEFVVALQSPLGLFYISSVNLFNDKSNNVDTDNTSGYVRFTDDENINQKAIKSDKDTQKSVLENNAYPFDDIDLFNGRSYQHRFGDVGLFGRYGNRIVLTKKQSNSQPLTSELFIDNENSTIQLTTGGFSYERKSSIEVSPEVNREINPVYENDQIYFSSDRLYITAGSNGMFAETSGLMNLVSDKGMFLRSGNPITLESDIIHLGYNSDEQSVLGNSFMEDFKELLNSMVRFAETMTKQDKIIALANAGNNFLTDLEALGWDDFNSGSYLSEKVMVE